MNTKKVIAITCVAVALLLASCTSFWQGAYGTTRKGVSSSLVSYLYPAGEKPPPYDAPEKQRRITRRAQRQF